MRSYLYFLLGFSIISALMFSCSSVHAGKYIYVADANECRFISSHYVRDSNGAGDTGFYLHDNAFIRSQNKWVATPSGARTEYTTRRCWIWPGYHSTWQCSNITPTTTNLWVINHTHTASEQEGQAILEEYGIDEDPDKSASEVVNQETCENPILDCDEQAQAALDACGDLEFVEFDYSDCSWKCDCEAMGKPTYQDFVDGCGGTKYAGDWDKVKCEGECQDEPCKAQKEALARECGGARFIGVFFNTTCTGSCLECGREHEYAQDECGRNKYSMDSSCNWNCQDCTEFRTECESKCGGSLNIGQYACDEQDKFDAKCECLSTDPPDPRVVKEDVEDIQKDGKYIRRTTQIIDNGDGTYTKKVTEQELDPETKEPVIDPNTGLPKEPIEESTTTSEKPDELKEAEAEKEEEDEEQENKKAEDGEEMPEGLTSECPEGEICIGDGICQQGEPDYSKDCSTESYYSERFDEFKTAIEGTGIFTIVTGLDVPSGGSPTQSVDMGSFGTFTYKSFDLI